MGSESIEPRAGGSRAGPPTARPETVGILPTYRDPDTGEPVAVVLKMVVLE